MKMRVLAAAAGFAALTVTYGLAQTPCKGTNLAGTVRDSTQAVIPNAKLTLDGGRHAVSGADGRFRFTCVGDGAHGLATMAEGFAKGDVAVKTPRVSELDVVLRLASVETEVSVSGARQDVATETSSAGVTTTIAGDRLQALADDPDDLLREVQQLAAAGGNPANVTISVDGFQGSTGMPPKSSIAYIKVNPDQFSAEYREPPFDGARVEVYTKPGQKAFHGALFLTNGSPWENARDPFSTSKAALGKQRYGFELNGPVRKTGSDFALTMEHRIVNNFAAVDAVELDGSGNQVDVTQNVATPQHLWLATARVDWQLGAKNTLIASYSANANNLQNVGVGGSSLAETGYNADKYEHIFRLSDVTTVSAHLMHEARLSLRWDGEGDSPVSTAPQVQVAGAFTGGGATNGPRHLAELNIEADDDAILTTKNHTMKFGTVLQVFDEREKLTTNFNGTYTFGGGVAPVLDANGNPVAGQTQTISGVEQYRRALKGLPGGTPTAFSNVAGSPQVNFTMAQEALFFQDDWNVGHNVHIAYGLRYFVQNDPTTLDGLTPRLGILWSPSKKNTWTLHAHAGMFTGQLGPRNAAEMFREDGVHRVTSTAYNPVYCGAAGSSCNPLTGAVAIYSMRTYAPHMSTLLWAAENVGGTRALPGGWNLSADYYFGRMWNYERTENVNSPLNGVPTGPRPGPANTNVFQMQSSGQGTIGATFASIEQHSLKHVQMFVGAVRVELIADTDDDPFSSPQTAGTDAGEFGHRAGQNTWNYFGNATFTLPKKVQLSTNFNGGAGAHYNITTGFDNNGDGNFNDRPQYATPGQAGAVATPFGLLVASGGTGVFPRNKGLMPATIYLDANVQRAFVLTRNAKAEHQQTVTVNVRSSNVLNRLNVTQEGGVLGSPLFGVPYQADNGRRVEAGLRYAF
jgi:hypothetical protein